MRCNARIAIYAAAAVFGAHAARLNGSDSNSGSIGAPWKTLVKIHNLEETVYITNSAVCYFSSAGDLSPSNVLLTSGNERQQHR